MTSRRIVLAGGGLANCLIAYRLAALRPEVDLVLVEADLIGGNHTWCFHATDLTAAQQEWIAPLIVRSWEGYSVHFPDKTRRLALGYRCVTAERLRGVMRAVLPNSSIQARVVALDAHDVTLDSGEVIEADLVLDGRGAGAMNGWGLAWQGFLGFEVRLAAPHGLAEPIIMDATVPQESSYRFFYCLPLTATELLIEDTRYWDRQSLDLPRMRVSIHDYAKAQGWKIQEILREEKGLLPIVLSGQPALPTNGAVPVGLRAGLFHPVTGYSLPHAVRFADVIAAQGDLTTEALRPFVISESERQWRSYAVYRLLNRMLFMAGPPEERWRMLSRFYGLSEPVIARFYSASNSVTDSLRILMGRPPVSIRGALACVPPSSAKAFVGSVAEA